MTDIGKRKEIKIRIPDNILKDLNICLRFNKPDFDFKYNIDYFLYIISTIHRLSMFKKFKNLQKVPIYSKILRFELGKHYKRYLEYLLEFGFITTDNHYIVGTLERKGKCKCYSLKNKYKKRLTVEYVLTKKCLLSKIIAWKETRFGKMMNDSMLGHLYEMIQKINIDLNGAREYLNELVAKKELTEKKAQIELIKCEKINDKSDPRNIFVVRDDFGRVHSNITNISKHIRKNFMYIEGEKLIELDIKSCQPALLYTLFMNYLNKVTKDYELTEIDMFHVDHNDIYEPVDVRDKYVNRNNNYTGSHIYINEFKPLINNFGYNMTLDMLTDAIYEMKKYKTIIENDIYEFFQNKWKYFYKEDVNRSKIKKEWISYIFGTGGSPINEKMRFLWYEEFPLLTKILRHFKSGNYKDISHELQRRESDIIYGGLCPKVNEMNIDYFTVHDCIGVKESKVSEVYDVFNEVLDDNKVITGVTV